jgi:hypothetical protein
MRIFLAGVIGVRLIPLLVRDGHQIAGMTRSPGKAAALCELGAESVVCDVFATSALIQAVTAFGPELVMPQLSDRPIRLSGSLSSPPATTGAGPKGHATCWPPPRRQAPLDSLAQSIAWTPQPLARPSPSTSAWC